MQVTYNINNWNWQEVIFTRHTCKPNLKPEGLKNKAQSTVKAMEIKTRKKSTEVLCHVYLKPQL